MGSDAAQGLNPLSIIENIMSGGFHFCSPFTISKIVDVQESIGRFFQIILPQRLKEVKFAYCSVNPGADKIIIRPAGNLLRLALSCAIWWEIEMPTGAVFSLETRDVISLSGDNPLEWQGPFHPELLKLRGAVTARPVSIAPTLPIAHCFFEDLCSFRFKIESNSFLMFSGEPPDVRSIAWLNPSERSDADLERIKEMLLPFGIIPYAPLSLFLCGNCYEKTLLLFIAFWQTLEAKPGSMSIHPVIEATFPGLRKEARDLAAKFHGFRDIESVHKARKYLEKRKNIVAALFREPQSGCGVVGALPVVPPVRGRDIVCIPFPVLESTQTPLGQTAYRFRDVLRKTRGNWEYWNTKLGKWENAEGISFTDCRSGTSVLFTEYQRFCSATQGLVFQTLGAFVDFLTLQTLQSPLNSADLIG
jgi:hypothetical protein